MGEMASYMDPDESFPETEDDEDVPTFDGPDEDTVPLTDEPQPHTNWMCSGVSARTLKKKSSEPHMMPSGSEPNQPTTDAAGKYMEGGCPECGTSTIWKKVTL